MDLDLRTTLHDPERLAALYRLALLNAPAGKALDRLARLAQRLLQTSVAVVCLVDQERQVIHCTTGRTEPWTSTSEVCLSPSFCQYVVATGAPVLVNDVRIQFPECEPVAREFGFQSYLGVPLRTSTGQVIGAFCVLDGQPRNWTEEEAGILGDLGTSVMTEIELRSVIVEREEAEQSRKRSESLFRALVQNSSDILTILNADGTVRYQSPSVQRLLGSPPEEWVGKNAFDRLHPDDRPLIEATFAQHIGEPGAVVGRRFRVRHADGSYRVFETIGANYLHEPEVQGLVLNSRDVSAQQAAEDALRVSEARYRTLFDASPIPMWVYDPETYQFVSVNDTAVEKYGYTHDEFRQMTLKDIRPAEEMARLIRAHDGGVPAIWDAGIWRHRKKNGELIDVEICSSEIHVDGRLLRLAVANDITERLRAEERFRHQLAITESITNHMADGLCLLDAVGRFIYLNPAAEEILGWQETELAGRDVHDAIHFQHADGEYFPREECPLLKGLLAGTCLTNLDEVFTRKDGSRINVRFSLAPIVTEGQITGGVLTFQDLTVRQGLQEQLRQSQKMDAFGRLAGGVAHDFNNMLAVINGYSEFLLNQIEPGSTLHSALQEIARAGERAAGLTRQLLAFSRKQVLEPRVLDLHQVVTSTEKMLRRLIGEDIELRTLADPQLTRVKADPGQIEQVLLNLAVNSRDAMPQGGHITFELRNVELDDAYVCQHPDAKVGPHVMLVVSDTGSGIQEAHLAQIFEPFFTTKPPGQGTGLGLATVFGIIKQSGGHLTVQSRVGYGTTFQIYLPAVEAVEKTEAVPEGTLLRGSETVLVVEDEDMVRGLVSNVLQMQGFTVLAAANGQEAIAQVQTHPGPIHLLLTDVVMPGGMSGRVIAEKLMEFRPHLRVLFMSGYTDDAVVRHGIFEAQTPFIQKPFTPVALARKVRALLDTAPPFHGQRGKILILDDEEAARVSLAEVLEGEGYEVEIAAEGQQGLELLHQGYRPDVILLDLMMPGMNGWVFRLEQQKDPALAHIPVIILSGHQDPGPAAGFLMAESLAKPLDIPLLLARIDHYLGQEKDPTVAQPQ